MQRARIGPSLLAKPILAAGNFHTHPRDCVACIRALATALLALTICDKTQYSHYTIPHCDFKLKSDNLDAIHVTHFISDINLLHLIPIRED